jgi:HK97 gp10 family phage protein
MGKVTLDSGFEAAVLRSPEVQAVLKSEVSKIESRAKSNARSISTSIANDITSDVGVLNGQLVGRVIAMNFKSHWFEFGTVKMRARPFLQPAAVALGYSLKAGRRG